MNILRLINKQNLKLKISRWRVIYEENVLNKRINCTNHYSCSSKVYEKLLEKKNNNKQYVVYKDNNIDYYLPYCL